MRKSERERESVREREIESTRKRDRDWERNKEKGEQCDLRELRAIKWDKECKETYISLL